METLFTDLTVSMSDFKKNPSKILRDAGTQPVAILNHNKAAFYMVAPSLLEAILEDLADAQITPLLKARQATRAEAIEVDIEEI
jgi:antitoxin StbD